jgi:quercetin dioxygenase-like cupin family protein
MNADNSSCEIPPGDVSSAPASRVVRCQPGFRWRGVPATDYKAAADHWAGVTRMTLVGDRGEKTAFQVRYFELAPGGHTSLEHHGHEHAVVVLRGTGHVWLGETVHELSFGDAVYVAPHERHQFRNPSEAEPFGFLCMVDAQRDRPVVEKP